MILFGNYNHIWVKVYKNGPSKICGRHPLKNLKRPSFQVSAKPPEWLYHLFFIKKALSNILLKVHLVTCSQLKKKKKHAKMNGYHTYRILLKAKRS